MQALLRPKGMWIAQLDKVQNMHFQIWNAFCVTQRQ